MVRLSSELKKFSERNYNCSIRWKRRKSGTSAVRSINKPDGKDIDYLTHKSKQAHIMSFTGSERGTSSQCPVCGHKHKPKKRNWVCKACGFTGHRDIVGSVNMRTLAFDEQVMFPRSVTYLRPSKSRRSSRADAPLASSDACCLSQSPDQPLLHEQVPTGIGHTVEVTQKLIPF
jgi:putative transposase